MVHTLWLTFLILYNNHKDCSLCKPQDSMIICSVYGLGWYDLCRWLVLSFPLSQLVCLCRHKGATNYRQRRSTVWLSGGSVMPVGWVPGWLQHLSEVSGLLLGGQTAKYMNLSTWLAHLSTYWNVTHP